MTKKLDALDIIELLAENQVNITWTPKCVWLRKTLHVVDVVNPELCIKLSDHGMRRHKALTEGLRLLGIEV